MTQITIPNLPLSSVIPLNSLFPFENLQNNETQATTLATILSNVQPKTKLYLNNVLSGTYTAINFKAGSNVSFNTSNTANYFNVEINSTIPNPLTITNVGIGLGVYKNYTSTYNFKSLVAGPNITLTPGVDSIEINAVGGLDSTVSTVGTGVPLFKAKVGSNLQFKSIVAGSNISIDSSNPNQLTINSSGSGGSSSIGQNIGVGTGRVYSNNISSVLRFKTIRAGANIFINDGASEITISAGSSPSGGAIVNTNETGNKIINNSGQVKTLIAGNGVIILDTEASLTLETNTANNLNNVGSGIGVYKGFNSTIDKHELRSIRGEQGIIVEQANINEIVIKGNSSALISSTSATNTLISSQVGSTTTLKVINSNNLNAATIINNSNELALNILNSNPIWNANKINNVSVTFPTSPLVPAQESTFVYRGSEYVTGTPNNLAIKYLSNQMFGATIPSNNQVFKIVGANIWGLALPADSTSPFVNFLGFYTSNKVYLPNNIVDNLTGIIAGSIYYLNSSSTMSTTASSIIIGIGLNTTSLWFKPYAV